MSIINRFPDHIAMGAQATTSYETMITSLANGHERRNAARHAPKRRFDISTGVRTSDDLHDLMAFFHAQAGAHRSFLFRDFSDYKSCSPSQDIAPNDQWIAMADGKQTAFQLTKQGRYGGQRRMITKPIGSTVKVMIEDQTLNINQHFSVSDETGLVNFADPPEARANIYAGFEFLIPVRFENDELTVSLDHFEAGTVGQITLIEVFDEVAI